MLDIKECVPGTKIVCVKLPTECTNKPSRNNQHGLLLDHIYTIKKFFDCDQDGGLITLEGNNEVTEYGLTFFRTIDPKTEIFYDMLDQPLDDRLMLELSQSFNM